MTNSKDESYNQAMAFLTLCERTPRKVKKDNNKEKDSNIKSK